MGEADMLWLPHILIFWYLMSRWRMILYFPATVGYLPKRELLWSHYWGERDFFSFSPSLASVLLVRFFCCHSLDFTKCVITGRREEGNDSYVSSFLKHLFEKQSPWRETAGKSSPRCCIWDESQTAGWRCLVGLKNPRVLQLRKQVHTHPC